MLQSVFLILRYKGTPFTVTVLTVKSDNYKNHMLEKPKVCYLLDFKKFPKECLFFAFSQTFILIFIFAKH